MSKKPKKIAKKGRRYKPTPLLETVAVSAELRFEGGKIIGWTFFSSDPIGAKILRKLRDGKVPGLEYCKDTLIRPFMGGRSEKRGFEYWVGFPIR